MKSFIKTLLTLSSGALLLSCGVTSSNKDGSKDIDSENTNSSDTSSNEDNSTSSKEDDSISLSFSNAYSFLINKGKENENDFASSETKIEIEKKNDYVTTTTTNNKIFADDTSYLEQKEIKVDEKNNTKKEESSFGRSLYQIDKIETGEYDKNNKPIVGDYPMYYFAFVSSNPSDSYVEKKFVVNSKEEATNGGLYDDEYVLKNEKSYESSLKLSEDLSNYIASLITSQYVVQTGISSFVGTEKENGIEYTMELSYSYDGDLGNDVITMNEECSFLVSENRLIEYKYQTTLTDEVKGDEPYVKIISKEGKITYGEKENAYTSNIDPNDYFLTEVNEIRIVDGYDNELDKDNLSKKNTYVFAKPISYLPENAIGVNKNVLTPISSTDENVISISSNVMEIKGEGKATITLNYFGKGNDDVWQNKTKTIDLVVERPKAESVYIQTDAIKNNVIGLGKEVTFDVDVIPLAAIQDIEAISSDNKIISVTWSEGKATIKGLSLGEATITFFSKSNPSVSKSMNLKCQEAIDQGWFNENVLNHTFKFDYYGYYTNTLEYTLKITFEENGKGKLEQEMANSSKVYNDTFDYALDEDGRLSLTNWSYNYGYSTDPNDYEDDVPEKATIFRNDNGTICIKIYKPSATTYNTFERID